MYMYMHVGNVINIHTGEWTGRMSGLGAGIDSFYEYLLKVCGTCVVSRVMNNIMVAARYCTCTVHD